MLVVMFSNTIIYFKNQAERLSWEQTYFSLFDLNKEKKKNISGNFLRTFLRQKRLKISYFNSFNKRSSIIH